VARSSTTPSRISLVAYADQNEQDYQRLLQAVSAGRVLGDRRGSDGALAD
jgi:hypothetical protein